MFGRVGSEDGVPGRKVFELKRHVSFGDWSKCDSIQDVCFIIR